MNKEDLKKYGLKRRPTIPGRDDEDKLDELMSLYSVPQTFSDRDMKVLKGAIKKLGAKCKAVLEIGVNAHDPSSTNLILENVPSDCFYFGVDLSHKNLDKIRNEEKNIFCLNTNSSNYDQIVNFIKSKGVEKLDLIHIDGWHSVNQVLRDWKFVEILSDHGVVVLHDTNAHPGPMELLKALDSKVWTVKQHYKTRKDDWGIATVWRNGNETDSTSG